MATYAEYRAQRLATVDEPRVPSTWRMMWPSGMIVPNDRAARRRAERRSAEMDARRLVIPAAWFTDGRACGQIAPLVAARKGHR